jgi:hypothetical protein
VADLEEETALKELSLKPVQTKHFAKARCHSAFLQKIRADPPPSPLVLWLEAWRLQRLQGSLTALGVDVKEDLLDLTDDDLPLLAMRPLEQSRWAQATSSLLQDIRSFDFSDDPRCSVPTIATWLTSLRLGALREKLAALGAVELADLADVEDADLAAMKLSKLQRKHWEQGMQQVKVAKAETMADGKGDLYPSLGGWLESWRLRRLQPTLEEHYGAYVPKDMLDLDPAEYEALALRPLEAKRLEQAIISLEEEFLSISMPGGGGESLLSGGSTAKKGKR